MILKNRFAYMLDKRRFLSAQLATVDRSSTDTISASLNDLHAKLMQNESALPTLQEAIKAFNLIDDKQTDHFKMLLDFMIYNQRSPAEIARFLQHIPADFQHNSQQDDRSLVEYIVQAIIQSPAADSSVEDIAKLLSIKDISSRSKNGIVKALLTRSANDRKLESIKRVERLINHVDYFTCDLFLHAYNKCGDVDGVKRWLQFGLRVVDSSGDQNNNNINEENYELTGLSRNQRITRTYNYLIDAYCRTDQLPRALEVIHTQRKYVNAYSFGSILQSLPSKTHKTLTYSYVLQLMHNCKVKPELETFNTILWNVARRGRMSELYKWLAKMHQASNVNPGFQMDVKSWNALLACWCTHFDVTPSSQKLVDFMDRKPVFKTRVDKFQKELKELEELNVKNDELSRLTNGLTENFNDRPKLLSHLLHHLPDVNAKTRNLLLFLGIDKPDFIYTVLNDVKPDVQLKHVQRKFYLNPSTSNISTRAMVDATTLNVGIYINLVHKNPEAAFALMNHYQSTILVHPDEYSYALMIKYAVKTSRNDVLEVALKNLYDMRKSGGLKRSLVVDGNVLDDQIFAASRQRWPSTTAKDMIAYLRTSRVLPSEKFYGKSYANKFKEAEPKYTSS